MFASGKGFTFTDAEPEIENLLSSEQKLNIYRIIQECISNSIKHAETNSIYIYIQTNKKTIKLLYKDSDNKKKIGKLSPGFGLNSIKTRAEIINAKLKYSVKNNEFHLQIHIPVKSIKAMNNV